MFILSQIVVHTPWWVWLVLVLIVALGGYGLRRRVINPWRLALLPLIGMGTSLAGLAQSPRPGLAAAGWGIGLLAALPIGHALGRWREARFMDDGRLEIAGGWFMLLFGLSIFFTRYALGVTFGVMPWLKAEPLWVGLAGAVGGVVAGTGMGWLAGLLLRHRFFPMAR